MKNPFATQSVAPAGFVFELYQKRLSYRPKDKLHYINPEMLMAKYWEKLNRIDADHPLPMHTIIHSILPKLRYRTKRGEFYFDKHRYIHRDICIVSSIMQWFATNVGNCFIERTNYPYSIVKVEQRDYYQAKHVVEQRRYDMVPHWTHSCTPACYNKLRFNFWDSLHVFDYKSVTGRDRAVAKAVMLWLDTDAGNAFVKSWLIRRERAYDILNTDRMWRWKLQRVQAKIA